MSAELALQLRNKRLSGVLYLLFCGRLCWAWSCRASWPRRLPSLLWWRTQWEKEVTAVRLSSDQPFSCLFCSSEPPHFHLCNPNRPYISDICVTRRDIQFQRNYPPHPIAATSPSAVRTLNHKTRVSRVPALILTGSNNSVPTKSFWCLQQNNKWGS